MRISDTVVFPQLQAWPISLSDNPNSYLNLNICLVFSISSLLIIWPPLIIVIKGYLLFNDSTRCPDNSGNSVRMLPECCPDNSGNSVRMLPKYANIINKWSSIITNDSASIVKEKLDSLGKRKKQIESGIQSLENMIADIKRDAINKELVMLALNKFTEVFDHLQPYKQKELLKLVINKAILGKDEIKIALYGRLPEKGLLNISETGIRSQTVNWLPG